MIIKVLKVLRKLDLVVRKKIARKRLRVSNFTILCNTCVGGVIYNKLGQPFLTPTINIGFCDKDFFKFIHNLDFYLYECKLEFIETDKFFPVAYLGDIRLEFVHYHTEDEARNKWEERIKRVNKDNLYLICSDRPNGGKETEVTYEDIKSLKDYPCKNKVVFSTKHYEDIDYIINLPKDKEGDFVNIYMLDKTPILHKWVWEKHFDYVKWLNDGL